MAIILNFACHFFLSAHNTHHSSLFYDHQGMDMNAMEADPNAPMQTMKAKQAQEKKDKKVKPTRGGGGGFGAR